MERASIAIFDSGVGGLTVLKEALRQLPDEAFLYFGDFENVPYGEKSREEVLALTRGAIEQCLSHTSLKAFVIACNTATSAAAEQLRQMYDVPIIGMEPAVKPALKLANGKKVLVLATRFTLREQKFDELLHRLNAANRIHRLPTPRLVEWAERAIFDAGMVARCLRSQFSAADLSVYGAIVLGCTHFIHYRDMIEKISGLPVLDGNKGTVRQLRASITPSDRRLTPAKTSCLSPAGAFDLEKLNAWL